MIDVPSELLNYSLITHTKYNNYLQGKTALIYNLFTHTTQIQMIAASKLSLV